MSQAQTAVAPPEGALDAGVPWHYGDPLGEQRLLDSGQGFVDLFAPACRFGATATTG